MRFGGILNNGEAMLYLRSGDIVSIVINKGHVYRARGVALTLGARAAKFLPLRNDNRVSIQQVVNVVNTVSLSPLPDVAEPKTYFQKGILIVCILMSKNPV